MKAWVLAARPATLPAAVAAVVVGSALAAADGVFAWDLFAVTLFADPHTAMNPKGEIQESNERDNAYVGRASQFYQCLAVFHLI